MISSTNEHPIVASALPLRSRSMPDKKDIVQDLVRRVELLEAARLAQTRCEINVLDIDPRAGNPQTPEQTALAIDTNALRTAISAATSAGYGTVVRVPSGL